MITISIIILNWNGWPDTKNCLTSLENVDTTDIKLQIIVIDNGSLDNSVINIKKHFPKVILIENNSNLGFAGGNNIAVKYALDKSDYILLLNNDTICSKNLLTGLVEGSKKYNVQLLSPKIYFLKGYEFHKIYKNEDLGKVFWYAGGIMDWKNVIGRHRGVDEVDHGQYKTPSPTDFVTGACMFVKSDVFRKIGFFNEKYFLYYEDLDFCQRAKNAGFQLIYYPGTHIWHKNAGKSASGSTLQDYYITRNRLLFGLTYSTLKIKLLLIKEAVRLLLMGRYWQKKAILDFFLHVFGKGSYE